MNPFAELESFEGMRSAALSGSDDFGRYLRRKAVASGGAAVPAANIQLSERIYRMVRLSIASSRAVLLVGPPGTGKTQILNEVIKEFNSEPDKYGLELPEVSAMWVTPEEEWTFDSIVLGETMVASEVRSTEGTLLEAIANDQWLVFDEANRADMDRVLGGVLTWLSHTSSDQRVRIGAWKEAGHADIPVYLGWSGSFASKVIPGPPEREYLAGTDWRLLGTYNAVDAQRVFRMGQALSRRFKHIPIPPASGAEFDNLLEQFVEPGEQAEEIRQRVVGLYQAHLAVDGAALGAGLFTEVPRYMEFGLKYDSEAPFEDLLAEGYFASVGSLLSKFEPQVIDSLGVYMLDSEALSLESWHWIMDQLTVIRP